MGISDFSRERRDWLVGAGASALALALPAGAQTQPVRERLVLAGPLANVSFPLMRLAESGALAALADKVEFRAWTNPDQLRALAVDGGADFVAAPSNVAANLYNRGVPLKLLDVSVWGILWLVSRNSQWQTLADFKGQEITLPFRADMPDIVFQLLARRQGLDPQKDFRIRYVASPMDAMQLLVSRRTDHALLAEPAVSMALRKTRSFPVSVIAPELFRSVDLQREWGRVFGRAPRIPQAGIAAVGAVRDDAVLLAQMRQALAEAHAWCWANPAECGQMAARYAGMLQPEAVADSLQAVPAFYRTAAQAREELEFFYGLLLENQPALVGGRLPDAGFYG
ncbi:ABC transporter substrate-binding protein [Corticibacter populi]|uniref:ABC transporter substrate-binding protein n=1 Tax=Corticibacter populi TaxID=1550736 RepID=A0A3M6QZY2_9BURK|nr:PhnD/SsuA/transferrin family substrate-binding protein [Corticibacter populi]RMX08092.1 ABC transporter substrate-binding protein [Corticibacter populi]RZS35340.1 NitT/TauT family transport system substrate-binding protein [Corticibacter populi]